MINTKAGKIVFQSIEKRQDFFKDVGLLESAGIQELVKAVTVSKL